MSLKEAMRDAQLKRARASSGRADQYLRTHPGASASGLVRDMRQTIDDLVREVAHLTTATGDK